MTRLAIDPDLLAEVTAILAPALASAVSLAVEQALTRRNAARPTEGLIRADHAGLGATRSASARKVRQLVKAGRLSASRIGRHLYVAPGDLAKLAEVTRLPAPAGEPTKPANDHAPESGADTIARELGLRAAPKRKKSA